MGDCLWCIVNGGWKRKGDKQKRNKFTKLSLYFLIKWSNL